MSVTKKNGRLPGGNGQSGADDGRDAHIVHHLDLLCDLSQCLYHLLMQRSNERQDALAAILAMEGYDLARRAYDLWDHYEVDLVARGVEMVEMDADGEGGAS